ncbi:hypothetical protein PNOK_0584000 [Pyrrhoderma noxium]|uniref:DUF6533 domain-containing protein n=1 Tax=Pyrrhoderma noxium TaxID=2282107 RepID=A0A286UH91_9AGAM|nr:hypothetical protein PNOK_0584000 [Pyrrhoderma noxium]
MSDNLIQAMSDANATRYLNGIGLVILIYDHFLTVDDEIKYVWQTKASFAKRLFLCNRYAVPVVLITVACFMNNFNEIPLINTSTCVKFFTFSSLFSVLSIGIANILVLLMVVNLWERDRRVICLLALGFLVSFFATFSMMVVSVIRLMPGISYLPIVHMCVSTIPVKEIKAVWAAPMLFEVLVLISVCLNACARPRSKDTELARALSRDGIGFFSSLTILRLFNLILTSVARPSLLPVASFFVWAMTTLVLNRAIFNIYKSSTDQLDETSNWTNIPLYIHPSSPTPRNSSVVFDISSKNSPCSEEFELRKLYLNY